MRPEQRSRKTPVQFSHTKEHILMSDRKQQSLLKKMMKVDLEKDRVRKQLVGRKRGSLGWNGGGPLPGEHTGEEGSAGQRAGGEGPGGQLAGEHAGEEEAGCQQKGHQAECEHEAGEEVV